MSSPPPPVAAVVESLREQLIFPAHQYRIVRLFSDEMDYDTGGRIYTITAYTDERETGTDTMVLGSIHILDLFLDLNRDMSVMNAAVKVLNDHITASRRVLGLSTDIFTQNGFE